MPHGFSTTILVSSGFSDYLTIATILQSELKPLGINLKIQQLDPNTANTNQQSLKYDMTLTYWTMDIPDPDELATFARRPERRAPGRSSPPTTTPPWSRPRTTRSRPCPPRPGRTCTTRSSRDSAGDAFMAFLYYSPYAYATTSSVHGFYVTPLGNYHLENVWLSK